MTQSMPPSSWSETTIRSCLAGEFPGAWGSEPGRDGPNAHILRSTNLDDDGHINFATAAKRWIDEPHLTQRRLRDGDVLLESSGGGPGKPVGRVAHFQAPDSIAYLSSNFFRTLRPDETKVDSRFLAWRLLDLYRQPRIWNFQQQTTGIINLKTKDYLQQRFHLPERPEQTRIAAVLDTVDEAIAKTEAVIAKLRQVRAGLLHDLLTRGLDKNGQLRDPIAHPEQFQDSPLGQIPKEWGCRQLRDLVPPNRRITYGIVQPGDFDPNGVLLIRGQDYISGWASREEFFKVAPSRHESYRRSVTKAGDLLVCIVGATTGAVAQVPEWIEEANITQTTARVACEPNKLVARFGLHVLRSELGQKQVRRYVKGSAQPGLNLQDVEVFWTPVPNPDEQKLIANILDNHLENEASATRELAKLQQLKSGLMCDLLTGRVRVPETVAASTRAASSTHT